MTRGPAPPAPHAAREQVDAFLAAPDVAIEWLKEGDTRGIVALTKCLVCLCAGLAASLRPQSARKSLAGCLEGEVLLLVG